MHSIFVWTLDDMIGAVILGLLLVGGLLFIGAAYIQEIWRRWRPR